MAHPESIILIPTYNRPSELDELIFQIRSQVDDTILVFDDGSAKEYVTVYGRRLEDYNGVIYYRQGVNGGRRRWHELVEWMMRESQRFSWEYVFVMQDDLIVRDDAFESLFDTWRIIAGENDRPGLLNAIWDSRCMEGIWGAGPPVDYEYYWKTGWTDMMFMAPRSTFIALQYRIPVPSPAHFRKRQSSGVGMELGHALRNLHLDMYHMPPGVSAWIHRDGPSMMHPVERKRNPIKSE